MASAPVVEPFDIRKFFSGFINPTTWSKAIIFLVMGAVIVVVIVGVKNLFFPTKSITNKPHALVIGKAEKGAIDQTSTNIVVEKEKPFEIGGGVAAGEYDNKKAYGAMFWGKWKF